MDNNFVKEVKLKSIDELKEIAVNFNMYRGALVAAAKQELLNQGLELSAVEKQKIEEIKNKRKQDSINSTDTNEGWSWISVKWKLNIVDDLDSLQLYSRLVINFFSIFFSVLFGGILLAINLKTINNKKAILPVLIYSIVYTGLMIIGLNVIGGNTSLTALLNILGAIVLYNFFWGKYIGKDFKYRTKPF